MPKGSPSKTSFNGGELDPKLEGRTDLTRYASGCRAVENFIPQVQGPIAKRAGTKFVAETWDMTAESRLIPFEFSTTQAYILEFGYAPNALHGYMRVFKDGGQVLDDPQAITGAPATNPMRFTVTAHGYGTGQTVYISGIAVGPVELNDKFYKITVVDANNFELDGVDASSYTAWAAGGTAERVTFVTTPYAADDVHAIQYAQSADVLYLAHPDHPPQKIERTGHNAWTCTEVTFDDPPWAPWATPATMYLCATGTTVADATATVYATTDPNEALDTGSPPASRAGSAGPFTLADVGRTLAIRAEPATFANKWVSGATPASSQYHYWEGNVYYCPASGTAKPTAPPVHTEYEQTVTSQDASPVELKYVNSGTGYGVITSYVAPDEVVISITVELPFAVRSEVTVGVGNPSGLWAFSAFDAVNGYPRAVSFYEERLWWGGADQNPQTLYGSNTGDFENHRRFENDESAMQYTISTDQVNVVEWLNAGQVLVAGTAGGEFVATGASQYEAITPTSIRIVRHSTFGSQAGTQPTRVENVVLFAQRSGKKLREHVFDFDTDSYIAPDLTVLASHILRGQVRQMAFQSEPYRVLWCVLQDGSLVGMTYERDQEVGGWHRHILGGLNAKVRSVGVIPHPDGADDQVWIIVERTVNGATLRSVEYMERQWDGVEPIADAFYVDSGLTYSGAAATTISGIDHLEGETVTILADGMISPPQAVVSGAITLPVAAAKVTIGLPYEALVETMRMEAAAADGTAQGKIKRLHNLVIRLWETGPGLHYGRNQLLADMTEYHTRDAESDPMNAAPVPENDDTPKLQFPGAYDQRGTIGLRHVLPYPCTIISLMPQLLTQDR